MDIKHLLQGNKNSNHTLRKSRTLKMLLTGSRIFVILFLLGDVVLSLVTQKEEWLSNGTLAVIISCITLLGATPVLLRISDHYSSSLASLLFLGMLIVMFTIVNGMTHFLQGYGVFWFVIPIVFAGFISHRLITFVAAGTSALSVVLISLLLGEPPEWLIIVGFFVIAAISFFVVKSMEDSSGQLEQLVNKLNEQLNETARDKEDAINDSEAKSAFLTNISHEIRTPMSAILGISKYLIDYTSENLNEDQKEGLDMIHQSSKRLLSLVNEILDLSKIDAGKMQIKAKAFSLEKLINDLKGMLSTLSREKKVVVYFQVDAAMPEEIVSDEERIYQILWNVIKTGFKNLDKGEIVVHLFKENNNLVLEVKINDKGSSGKYFAIFNDNVNLSEKGNAGGFVGSTLGLTLCKKVLAMMGGHVSLDASSTETRLVIAIPFGESARE